MNPTIIALLTIIGLCSAQPGGGGRRGRGPPQMHFQRPMRGMMSMQSQPQASARYPTSSRFDPSQMFQQQQPWQSYPQSFQPDRNTGGGGGGGGTFQLPDRNTGGGGGGSGRGIARCLQRIMRAVQNGNEEAMIALEEAMEKMYDESIDDMPDFNGGGPRPLPPFMEDGLGRPDAMPMPQRPDRPNSERPTRPERPDFNGPPEMMNYPPQPQDGNSGGPPGGNPNGGGPPSFPPPPPITGGGGGNRREMMAMGGSAGSSRPRRPQRMW